MKLPHRKFQCSSCGGSSGTIDEKTLEELGDWLYFELGFVGGTESCVREILEDVGICGSLRGRVAGGGRQIPESSSGLCCRSCGNPESEPFFLVSDIVVHEHLCRRCELWAHIIFFGAWAKVAHLLPEEVWEAYQGTLQLFPWPACRSCGNPKTWSRAFFGQPVCWPCTKMLDKAWASGEGSSLIWPLLQPGSA